MSKRVFNFSAGPAGLPYDVLKEAQEEFLDYNNIGASIVEISHRSKDFMAIIEGAQSKIKSLLNLGENYHVLFLQGVASSQFYMVPMNFVGKDNSVDYIDTGAWTKKAIKEAKLFTNVNVVASSSDKNYNYIPKNISLNSNSKYTYLCSNNTIFGTQYKEFPKVDNYLVGDFSSDVLSMKRDLSDFGIIFAGAQKNLGPAGVAIVIIRNDILKDLNENIPSMLSYKTHIDKSSMFNTPPVFPIYIINKVLDWIEKSGGVEAVEKNNIQKANLIYNQIDNNDIYTGVAEKDDRSNMNITFNLTTPELESKFIEEALKEDLYAIKGHRSVGGIRASVYNAMPIEGCQKLSDFMSRFAKNN